MTYEQYWYGDPLMVRAFYKADRLRKKQDDENAWLHGLYIKRALESTVGNMFREKGTQPVEYLPEPITMTHEKELQAKKEEREKENEALFAMAWMTTFVQAGKNWGKNKVKER